MEIQNLKDDIRVFYIKADSFPSGVGEAHKKLHSLIDKNGERKIYGISHQSSTGEIIYKAAAEETYPGEAVKLGCDVFVIRKGDYICETLRNWRNDEGMIGSTFRKLLADPRIDMNGYCLEDYLNDTDMICMVKLG